MIRIDMNGMTETLAREKPSKTTALRSCEQIGKTARIRIGTPGGIQHEVRVEILAYLPSYGRSRWAVRAEDGQQEIVSAERLILGAEVTDD